MPGSCWPHGAPDGEVDVDQAHGAEVTARTVAGIVEACDAELGGERSPGRCPRLAGVHDEFGAQRSGWWLPRAVFHGLAREDQVGVHVN